MLWSAFWFKNADKLRDCRKSRLDKLDHLSTFPLFNILPFSGSDSSYFFLLPSYFRPLFAL